MTFARASLYAFVVLAVVSWGYILVATDSGASDVVSAKTWSNAGKPRARAPCARSIDPTTGSARASSDGNSRARYASTGAGWPSTRRTGDAQARGRAGR